jgi:telomere length regulation protein
LALGARTLAGLPTTISPPTKQGEIESQAFPSQKLPEKLHQRYLKAASVDENARELSALTEDITNIALSRTRENAEGNMPQAAKEKLLSVRETRHMHNRPTASRGLRPKEDFPAYNDLAVGTFIMPILNRFWLYLQDVSTSPQNFRTGVFKGGSVGSVTLLEPMLLSKFLATITILVDTARHSPHFLAVLAPETLELVLAIRGIDSDNEAVRTGLLQLALAVVDNSTSLDGGRMLARDYTKTIWQLKDWAEEVWRQSEGKGVGEEGRAAAGLLLRIDSVVTKTVGYV